MAVHSHFDTFVRSAFGIEPGGRVGAQLAGLASPAALSRGMAAPLDQASDQIVFVAQGATKLSAHASLDREQIVAFHFGGDIVSVPSDGPHSYQLTALVDSELLIFPGREFLDFAAADTTMARSMLERLPSALHRCRDKAVALGQKSALERLAGFLVAMTERVGRLIDGKCTLDLPMSRRDIGDSLGLTIETVSRQLGILREAGLIETRGRSRIVIFDLATLTRWAGHLDRTEKISGDCTNLISINAATAAAD